MSGAAPTGRANLTARLGRPCYFEDGPGAASQVPGARFAAGTTLTADDICVI